MRRTINTSLAIVPHCMKIVACAFTINKHFSFVSGTCFLQWFPLRSDNFTKRSIVSCASLHDWQIVWKVDQDAPSSFFPGKKNRYNGVLFFLALSIANDVTSQRRWIMINTNIYTVAKRWPTAGRHCCGLAIRSVSYSCKIVTEFSYTLLLL